MLHAAFCGSQTHARDVRPMSCPRRLAGAGHRRARTTGRPGPRRRRRRSARAPPGAHARPGLKVVPPHIKRDRVNMSALVCIETARTDAGGAAPSCARFVTRHDDRFCNAVTRTHSGVQPHACARPVRPTSRYHHHTPPLIQQRADLRQPSHDAFRSTHPRSTANTSHHPPGPLGEHASSARAIEQRRAGKCYSSFTDGDPTSHLENCVCPRCFCQSVSQFGALRSPGLEGRQCREHLGGGRVLILGDGA